MKIAVSGLGRMEMQIVRKLAESEEHTAIAHNRSPEPIDEAAKHGAVAAYTKEDVLKEFGDDQIVLWLMLPDSIVVEQVDEWLPLLPKGSILIDGGNSDFRNTRVLNEKVKAAGMHFLDFGVSGGVHGYTNGFPIMCGGDSTDAFATVEPALKTLTQPGGAYYHHGPSGAGHYVKMVHNAIEYGMMESLGEGYRMLKEGPYPGMNLAAAGEVWQHHSVITSWLNELSRDALAENPNLDGITGYVAESGEARWTLNAAKDMGIELPSIQAAFDVRVRSQKGETNFATKVVAAQRNKFGGHNLNGEREGIAMPDGSSLETRPSIIVIFGITGDLAQRKLLPALYHLMKDNLLDEKTVILGITRRDVSVDELLQNVELCVNEIDKICDPVALRKVHAALRMHQMSQTDPAEYKELYGLLNSIEAEQGVCMNRLYYLSIPPQMFEPIVRNLGQQGLNQSCQHGTADTRLLVEKPFGYDLQSARDLIKETGAWFNESQLFRIDHYLAKDTVQNIIAFRNSAPQVEEIWNGGTISGITITAFEKIDIEGRATFYEEVGALRDFIQSHLLQLLAVVTMELPEDMTSEAVHKTRLQLLEQIAPLQAANIISSTKRGQYEGYRDEVGNPDSDTETYAEVQVVIERPRWDGVMVALRTGKAMAEKRTDVQLDFAAGNGSLKFSIQPDAGVSLEMSDSAEPEFFAALRPAIEQFNADHPPSPTAHPDAYERVLLDAVRGDHTLFTTSEEVIAAWRVVTGVVHAWSKGDEGLIKYPKGSSTIS